MVTRNFWLRSASIGERSSLRASGPMKAKFSGNPTSSAPRRTASSICSSAAAQLASGSEVLVSWIAAARKLVTAAKSLTT